MNNRVMRFTAIGLLVTMFSVFISSFASAAQAADVDNTSIGEVHRGESTTLDALIDTVNDVSIKSLLTTYAAEYSYVFWVRYSDRADMTRDGREYRRYIVQFSSTPVLPMESYYYQAYTATAEQYRVVSFGLYLDDGTAQPSVSMLDSLCPSRNDGQRVSNNRDEHLHVTLQILTNATLANAFYYSYSGGNYTRGLADEIYSNYDISSAETGLLYFRANLASNGSDIGLQHSLQRVGSSYYYEISWDAAALADYEVARAWVSIDVVYAGNTYTLQYNINTLTDGESIKDGKIRVNRNAILTTLVEYLGLDGISATVDGLTAVNVTGFKLIVSDADGAEDERTFVYNDVVLDIITGTTIDSSHLDDAYENAPSEMNPDWTEASKPVDYPSYSWRSSTGYPVSMYYDIAGSIIEDGFSYGVVLLSDHLYYSSLKDVRDSVYQLSSISNKSVSLIPSSVTFWDIYTNCDVVLEIDVSGYTWEGNAPDFSAISELLLYLYDNDPTFRINVYYRDSYYFRFLYNLSSLERLVPSLDMIRAEIDMLYSIEYLQYDVLYTMYKMQEAELLRQTDYLRNINASLSDLNARYVPFDDAEILTALRSLSLLDEEAVENAIVNALSKIVVNVRLPDDSGEDDGGILDSLLPEWLVELKNFVQHMITGDGLSFEYLVRLFTFYTDSDSGFYIDSDADGTILDEWRNEETWSP